MKKEQKVQPKEVKEDVKKDVKKEPKEVKEEIKKYQLSKTEMLEIENCQLKIGQLQNQANGVILNFCKRIGQKPEDIMANSFGQIYIDPQGQVSFQFNESQPKKDAPKKR